MVEEITRTRVVLINNTSRNDDLIVYKLFHSEQCVYMGEFLVGRSLVNFRINSELHRNIRRLIIFNPKVLENLSNFDSLHHLEVIAIGELKRPRTSSVLFAFTNVEIINFNIRTTFDVKYILDTPKLKYLKTNLSLNYLKVMHPETLQELTCPNNHLAEHLFVNLRVFRCLHFYSFAGSLDTLSSLEEFHFYNMTMDFHEIQHFFDNFNNLRVYYKNFRLEDDPIESHEVRSIPIHSLEDAHLETCDTFADLVAPLLQSELNVRHLDSRSLNVIRQLTNLKALIVSGTVTSREKFIELMMASQLEQIEINCSLDQALLNEIPTYSPYLTRFKITNCNDIRFIFRLKYLKTLITTQFFEFVLLRRLLTEFRYLRMIQISFFKMEILNDRVLCKIDTICNLDESKDIFIQTIYSINSWTALFELE